ncbi:hypothetical protein [Lacticigenium naphthae]|uniref:hypothetical protein n=1 Tax=Lacticigenium naphthae TaxID=515351 RepID=UPI0004269F24
MKFFGKKGSLLTLFAASTLLLAACGDDAADETADTTADTTEEAVSAASITDQAEEVVASLSADGNWITAITESVEVSEDVTVAGEFTDGGEEGADVYRKLALYAQDDDRNVTDEFTLTVASMTVESPNFRIQNGTVVGDIQVNAEGFELAGSTVEGNVTFASQELMDSAKMDEGTVNGDVTVADGETDAVSAASISDQPDDLIASLAADGSWIFAATDNIEVEEDVTVEGEFYDKDDETADLYRKLALYAQDDDRNVTDEYTLTVPTLIVESPNFRIQNGTVVGDIQVNAEGFEIVDATVEGNVMFESQELMDAANLDAAEITGETTVAE